MSYLGSERALIVASTFAVAVVVLSVPGAGPGAVLNFLPFVVGSLVALYFIVRPAVSAGLAAAGKAAAASGLRTAREISDARYAPGRIGPEDQERMRTRNPVAAGAYNPSGAVEATCLW